MPPRKGCLVLTGKTRGISSLSRQRFRHRSKRYPDAVIDAKGFYGRRWLRQFQSRAPHCHSSITARTRSLTRVCTVCILSFAFAICATGAQNADARTSHKSSSSTKVKVVLFGDSTGFTLGFSLDSGSLPSKLHYSLKDEAHIGCGLPDNTPLRFKGVVSYPGSVCNDTTTSVPNTPLLSQPLPVQWKAVLAKYHPNVVVLLAGRWQITDRLYDGVWTNILDPTFAARVKQQLESASDLFSSEGANVVFLTTPCVDETPPQPDGQPWPESDPARIAAYNTLVRQVAAENPTTDSVVDFNALVCPNGNYSATYKGVTIRTSDGIHFTPQAGQALGAALMPPILSAGREQIARIRAEGSKTARRRSG